MFVGTENENIWNILYIGREECFQLINFIAMCTMYIIINC